ncbi:MAG: response regulator [Candidatus Eiseniibacteriota bacterium]|nr:MAG: response regulator [Candidatus Eisenbacteria bacterium]
MKALLVVDDDQSCRKLYESEFADEGYTVTGAASGSEALELLERSTFDLVILDVKMPGMDGLETLCEIMKTKRNLPVVINSAYSTFKTNFTSWSAEAYVVKSSNLAELKRTVRSVLEERATAR